MDDVLAARCAAYTAPVLALMQLGIKIQGDPGLADQLLTELALVREQVRLGADGIDSPDYARWLAYAEGTIDRMEAAARSGAVQDVWAAFTDKEAGFYLLGNACAGYGGW